MGLWDKLLDLTGGVESLRLWIALFLVSGLVAGVLTGFFKARKIQPKGFKWKIFRNEGIFTVINIATAGTFLGWASGWLSTNGWIVIDQTPTEYWVIAFQFALYFFAFDTWFYWLHRWMHAEPAYSWVHKLHHRSTSPNLLTTASVNPLESLVNGGFVPLFLVAMTFIAPVNEGAMMIIGPTNIIMGLYVHSGYEFFPKWWNKSWATKWFITATFHDQHHKYFTANFGGYTTIWDRLCGTMRPKFEADYEKLRSQSRIQPETAIQVGTPAA
jgi:Delta7-sterol 5-desaturase